MFESLYVPTSQKAERAFDTIGFSMFDKKTGEVKNNLKGILELVEKVKQYDPKSQAKLIDTIFPTWGAKQFRAIFNDVDAFKERVTEAGQQTGLLQRQQEELSKSTQYQLQQLKASFDNLFTQAWVDNEMLAGPIKALNEVLKDPTTIQSLKELVSLVVRLGATVAENAGTILIMAKALGALAVGQVAATAMSLLGTAAGGAGIALARFGSTAMAAAGVMGPALTATASLKGIVAGLAPALLTIPTPLTLVVAAIATAGAAWYLFRDRTSEALQQSIDKVREFSREAIKSIDEVSSKIGQQSAATSLAQLKPAESKLTGVNSELFDSRQKLKSDFGLTNEDQIWKSAYSNDVSKTEREAANAYVQKLSERDTLAKKYYKAREDAEAVQAYEMNKAASDRADAPATASLKSFDGKPTKGKADKEAGKLEKQEIANLIKQLATSEQIYDAYYGRLTKLESASAEAGLKTREEAENNISELTAEQLTARVEMNKNFTVVINEMLKNSKKLQDSQREQLEGELERRQQLLLKLEQELQLNKELAEIKSQGAQKRFEDTIEKTNTSIFEDRDKRYQSVRGKAEDPVTAASNEGALLVKNKYAEQLRSANEELSRVMRGTDKEAQTASKNRLDMLTAEIQTMTSVISKEYAELEEYSRSAEYGWDHFWRKQQESALSAAQVVEKAMDSVMSNMTNEIISFTQTGEFNWKKMANAIFTDLFRMQTQFMISSIFGKGDGAKGGGAIISDLLKKLTGGGSKEAGPGVLGAASAISSAGFGEKSPMSGLFEPMKEALSITSSSLGELSKSTLSSVGGLGLFSGGLGGTQSGLMSLTGTTSSAGSMLSMLGLTTQTASAATVVDTGVTQLSAVAKTVDVGATQADAAAKAASATASAAGSSGSWISSIMSLFLADGGAFNAGGTRAFASGGTFSNAIVNSPTLFKYAAGGKFQTGVMGEAGPEAVMPLARDSQGRLGVRYQPMRDASQNQKTTEAPPPPQNNIRIVNAFDTAVISDHMGSAEGEKVIMNTVRKNQSTIKQMSRA